MKTEAHFLGVMVDDELNWVKNVSSLKNRTGGYIGIMYKIK